MPLSGVTLPSDATFWPCISFYTCPYFFKSHEWNFDPLLEKRVELSEDKSDGRSGYRENTQGK